MTLASDHLAILCLSFPSYKVGRMSFYLTWLWWGSNTIPCLRVSLEKHKVLHKCQVVWPHALSGSQTLSDLALGVTPFSPPSLVLMNRKGAARSSAPTPLAFFKRLWQNIHNIKLAMLAILSTFTVLCNHDQYPFPELFHHAKLKLYPLIVPIPPALSPC